MAIGTWLLLVAGIFAMVLIIGIPVGLIIFWLRNRGVAKRAKLALIEIKKKEVQIKNEEIERERRLQSIPDIQPKTEIGGSRQREGEINKPDDYIVKQTESDGRDTISEKPGELQLLPTESSKASDRRIKKHKQKFKLHKPDFI